MNPIIVRRIVRTPKIVLRRLVPGVTIVRVIQHVVNSDLIVDVSESFIDQQSSETRSHEWEGFDEPPEKMSEINIVENEMLRTVSGVLDSPEEIYAKILIAQSEGMMISGSATQSSPGTSVG